MAGADWNAIMQGLPHFVQNFAFAYANAQNEAEDARARELKKVKEAWKREIRNWEEAFESSKKAALEAQSKVTEKENEIVKNRRVIEDLRKENEKLLEDNEQAKDILIRAEMRNEKLEEDLDTSKAANSLLQEKSSQGEATNSELQRKLDALQEELKRNEEKLKEERRKYIEYKTKLDETTSNLNREEIKLEENTNNGRKLVDEVADLQRQLSEKTKEIDIIQSALNTEREEKNRTKVKATRYWNRTNTLKKKLLKAYPSKQSLPKQTVERFSDETEDVTHVECGECGIRFPSLANLRVHQKAIHIVAEARKLLQRTAQDQDRQIVDEQRLSSPNQNRETGALQHQPQLIENTNGTDVGAADALQQNVHGVDETKSAHGHFCLCEKKFINQHSLNGHIKYHSMELRYPCKLCEIAFKQPSNLDAHYSLKHKESTKNIICSLCDQKFHTEEQLESHESSVHASNSKSPRATRNRSQPDCSRSLNRKRIHKDRLSKKIIKETSPTPTASTSKRHVQSLAEEHDVEGSEEDQDFFEFACGLCIVCVSFKNFDDLLRHYDEVHQEPNLLSEYKAGCKLCGEMFRKVKDYHAHLKNKHSKNVKKIEKPGRPTKRQQQQPQPSSSKVASKSTNSSRKVHYHRDFEVDDSWICVCGFEAVDRNTLDKHIAENSGDKKYECNVCLKRFNGLNNLQGHHKRAHRATNRRLLPECQRCGKAFLSRSEHVCHNAGENGPPKRKTRRNKTLISKPASERSVSASSSSQRGTIDNTRKLKPFKKFNNFVGYSACTKGFEAMRRHENSDARCRRKRRRIEHIDLTLTPAPHREDDYLQQQYEQVTTPENLNVSLAQGESSTGNQTDFGEPQPSTSKGLPVSRTNDRMSFQSSRAKIRPRLSHQNYTT